MRKRRRCISMLEPDRNGLAMSHQSLVDRRYRQRILGMQRSLYNCVFQRNCAGMCSDDLCANLSILQMEVLNFRLLPMPSTQFPHCHRDKSDQQEDQPLHSSTYKPTMTATWWPIQFTCVAIFDINRAVPHLDLTRCRFIFAR